MVKVTKELKAIFSNDSLTGSKKLTEAGKMISNTTKDYAQTINTKAAQLNVSKWGIGAATAGAGIGLGAFAAGTGIGEGAKNAANGIIPTDEEGHGDYRGIVVVILLIAGVVVLKKLIPKIKKWWRK